MGVFDQAFDYLIEKDESDKFTNDKADNGGATKYGVTKHTLEIYLGREVTIDEVKNMTSDLAKEVYLHLFWSPNNLGSVTKFGIALCIFTTSALYGATTAANMAQRAANICGGSLKIDGDLGDKSIATLNILKQEEFLKAFRSLVLLRIETVIKANPADERFRHGWTNRADRIIEMDKITLKLVS